MSERPSAFRQLLTAVSTGNYGAGAGDYPEEAYQTQGEANTEARRLLGKRTDPIQAIIARLDGLMKNKGLTHSQALAQLKPEEAQMLIEHYAGGGPKQ